MLILFGHHLFLSFCFAFITWCIYLKVKNSSIIDINWVLGFGFIATYDYFVYPSVFLSNVNKVSFFNLYGLIVVVVWIWALRLATFFLMTRIFKRVEDTRYSYLKKSYKSHVKFKVLLNYLFQGCLQAILSFVFVAGFHIKMGFNFGSGVFLCGALIAILGQAIADFQLYKFKLVSESKAVCNVGLWYYSRHPNYFFEVMFWFCIAGILYFSTGVVWCFYAPLLIYLIMRYLTGPLTEKLSIAKRGESYLEYMNNTPMIFLNILKGSYKK